MENKAARFFEKHQIAPQQISYVIREDKRTAICLVDGRTFYTYITLKDMLDDLPQEQFLRVNKSYILALGQIAGVVNGTYTMKDGRVFVGRAKGMQDHKRVAKAIARTESMSQIVQAAPLVRQGVLRAIQQTAMEAFLRNCYRVLKVDLTGDNYVVIHDEVQQNPDAIPKTISGWLKAYRDEGYVHPDDLKEYNYYTSLPYLRGYFARHDSALLVRYRRRVGNDFRWAMMELVPAEDNTPQNQMVYLYVMDIHNSIDNTQSTLWKILQGLSSAYSSIFYVDFDRDSVVTYRSNQFTKERYEAIFNQNPSYEDLYPSYIREFVAPEDQEQLMEAFSVTHLERRFREADTVSLEYRSIIAGREVYLRVRFVNISEGSGLHKMVLAFSDISAEKRVEMEKYLAKPTVAILSGSDALAGILEQECQIRHWRAPEALLRDWSRVEKEIDVFLVDAEDLPGDRKQVYAAVNSLCAAGKIPIMLAASEKNAEGEEDLAGLDVVDTVERPFRGEIVRNRVNAVIRMGRSAILVEQLQRDELTGLYERKAFNRYATGILNKHPEKRYQILFSDMEDFKIVNERYDRKTCDEMLTTLAQLLQQNLPGCLLGVRIYADKFAFLLENVERAQLEPVLEKVRQWERGVGTQVKFGFIQLDPTVSIYTNCDRARMVLNTIKGSYGVQLAEYNETFRQELLWKRRISTEGESALHSGQFQLCYQPKMDLQTGKLGGAEELVRWVHPELGKISPAEFIPLFERSGFITQLDEYLCRQMCRDLQDWQAQGLHMVPVSINLSRRDFENDMLTDRLCEIVDGFGLRHDLIHFELTESAYTDAADKVEKACCQLRQKGFCIELDDFGTGYSSLNTLSCMELDYMKLDKSLVDRLDTPSGRAILRQMISLAKELGMKTIAEGVENQEQQEMLTQMGCDYIQGFYFSRPVEKEIFAAYLRDKT